jgi:hypothetical protein
MTRAARVLACATALLALAAQAAPGALRFDSESIRLEVCGDTLRVEGIYRFLATSPREPLALFYPYPVDSLLGEAWTESLAWRPTPAAPWTPLAEGTRPARDGVIWILPLGGSDRVEARTVYCQRLLARYARYIVTTTQAWPEPLREARFELILPPGMQLVESSFPFVREGEHWVYETCDFMPAVDVIVRWEPVPAP